MKKQWFLVAMACFALTIPARAQVTGWNQGYNPFTGTFNRQVAGYNPYTGNVGTMGAAINP